MGATCTAGGHGHGKEQAPILGGGGGLTLNNNLKQNFFTKSDAKNVPVVHICCSCLECVWGAAVSTHARNNRDLNDPEDRFKLFWDR